MLSKFFSCFSDSTDHKHVDLSNKSQMNQLKPELHPDSNINGQNIDFNLDSGRASSLQVQFLGSQTMDRGNRAHKFSLEQEDGGFESKITTASPSKTQHYQSQADQQTPDCKKNQYKHAKYNQRTGQNPNTMVMSMTEKKLNNYLQQAKLMITSNQEVQSLTHGRTKKKDKSFQNQEHLINQSYDSTKEAFKGGQIVTSSSIDGCELTESMLQNSFRANNSLKKDHVGQSKASSKLGQMPSSQNEKPTNKVNKNVASKQQERLNKQRKSDSMQAAAAHLRQPLTSQYLSSIKSAQNEGQAHLTINKDQFQSLGHKQEQGVNMNNFKLAEGNKNNTTGFSQQLHWRNSSEIDNYPHLMGPPAMATPHRNSLLSDKHQPLPKPQGAHKKTTSQLPATNTRNLPFSKKHTSSHASPVDRIGVASRKVQTEKKKVQSRNVPSKSGKKITASQTVEIKEVQKGREEEDSERLYGGCDEKKISPSASSIFQFQPKFYKPTNLPAQNLSRHAVSMNEDAGPSIFNLRAPNKKAEKK